MTTLAPQAAPGLLGQPVVAGADGAGRGAPATGRVAGVVASPVTLAGLDQAREDTWRAGRPPLLTFPTETLELPDGGAPTPVMKSAKMLEPISTSGMPVPMFLTADDLAGITDRNGRFRKCRGAQGRAVVNADRMKYWPVEDELEATGNVRLAQGRIWSQVRACA